MRCSKARQLMLLMRPGELDDVVQRRLESHLAGCPRCAAEAAAVARSMKSIECVREQVPVPADLSGLLGAIMRQVESTTPARVVHRAFPTSDSIAIRLSRAACGIGAVAIAAAFFLMSYSDAERMALLEKRMQSIAQLHSSKFAVLDGITLNESALSRQLAQLSEHPRSYASIDLGGVLAAIRSGSSGNEPEMVKLQKKYPRLWALQLDHGLDPETKKILVTDGRALLKDIQELVNLGDR